MTGSTFRGVLVRTAQEPLTLLPAVRHEVWLTDPNVALTLTGTMEGYISQFSYAGPRFGFVLMSIFGSIGLILVAIGVYSVLAYTTARRTQEIGIRMALGAQGSDVLGMVIRVGLTLVGIGVGLGLLVMEGDRHATVGSFGLRPVDADVRTDFADYHRTGGLLGAGKARVASRSAGGACAMNEEFSRPPYQAYFQDRPNRKTPSHLW